MNGEQEFAVVVGPKGIGKSTAVATAADGLPGVIIIKEVRPGTTKDVIMEKVWSKLNGKLNENNQDSEERARKIIQEFKYISGGKAPIVIISADMRPINDKPAELTATGRSLTEIGLNVLIDASENAMPSSLTGREMILEMTELNDTYMRKLPQFEKLIGFLTNTSNDELILAVCGGCPLHLQRLSKTVKLEGNTRTEDEKAVRDFYDIEMAKAHERIILLLDSYPKMKNVSFVFFLRN
jgi:hypothetical protein